MWLLFRLVPGDPAAMYISGRLNPEDIDAMRKAWGLDAPLFIQYLKYIGNLFSGNLGISFYFREPVAGIIAPPLFNTVLLMGPAMIVSIVGGIMLGAYLGWRRGSKREKVGIMLALLLRSFPVFVAGVFILMLLSYWLGWFPLGGMRTIESPPTTWGGQTLDMLHHMILPFVVVVLFNIGDVLMISRTSLLELLGEEFLEFGKARGLPDSHVRRMAMRNAIIPVLTYSTIMVGFAFGGQVLVEVVFSWPGIGRLMVESVTRHDYPVAQASFFLMSIVVIVLNLIMDLAYGYLDPRISYETKG